MEKNNSPSTLSIMHIRLIEKTLLSVFLLLDYVAPHKSSSTSCSGTFAPSTDFIANWTVRETVVSFVVTAVSPVGKDYWAALGFSERNESEFMVSIQKI